jgi:hypothetical protein
MIRILSLAAAVATLSLASCASLKKKGDCSACCATKPAAEAKAKDACCADGAGHDHSKTKAKKK